MSKDDFEYNPEGQPRAPGVKEKTPYEKIVEELQEFLDSTPEEVRKREAEFEKKLKRKRFTVIEGGKNE